MGVIHGSSYSSCLCLLHIMVILSIFLVSPTYAELPKFQHPPKCDGSLSFLVIGDWGRKGTYNQSEVAVQMGRIGEKLDIDFVISTGDNFYDDGIEGILDPAFKESFTAIYNAKSLQKQWYSVLGNHDYRGDTEAQLSPALRKVDSRWLCLRSFIVNAETAEFFLVDTTPFVHSYYNDSDHTYNWAGVTPREPYLANLLEYLESALKNSTAKWKFVIGHHAIRSCGHHGDTLELVDRLLPILKNNDVHFFVNGHDHCLEHISTTDSQIQFLTSGAGSKSWRGDVKQNYPHDVKFFYDGQGFMSVVLNNTHTQLAFYDINGDVLHKWDYSLNQLHSSI